jgi:hypothetical protein
MSVYDAFRWLMFAGSAVMLAFLLAVIGAEAYKSIAWKIRIARKYLKGELPDE